MNKETTDREEFEKKFFIHGGEFPVFRAENKRFLWEWIEEYGKKQREEGWKSGMKYAESMIPHCDEFIILKRGDREQKQYFFRGKRLKKEILEQLTKKQITK